MRPSHASYLYKNTHLNTWYVYLLQCENDMLYCGSTNDVERRYTEHCVGKGAKFTKINRPLELLAYREFPDRSTACKVEAQLKKCPNSASSTGVQTLRTQQKQK